MPASFNSSSSLKPDSAFPQSVQNFLKRRPSNGDIQLRPSPFPATTKPARPVDSVSAPGTKPDVVKILGPGTSANNLGYLVSGYGEAAQSFNALLQYPFLDAMINDSQDPDHKTDSNLRDLIVAALGEFNTYINNDISISRDLVGYSSIVELVLVGNTVKEYVYDIGPVIEDYAEKAARAVSNQDKVITNLTTFTGNLKVTIQTTVATIQSLTDQIELAKESLGKINIVKKLTEVLSKVFKMATDKKESDQKEQLASLLELSDDTLGGEFKELFDEKARLQRLVASLTKLQKSLSAIVALLNVLSTNLPKTVEASQAVAGVWVYVGEQLKAGAEVDMAPTKAEVTSINAAWKRVSEKALELQNKISGVYSSPPSVMSFGPNLIAEPAYPKTQAQINLMKLTSQAGIDSHSFATKAKIVRNRLVSDRIKEKHAKTLADIAAVVGDEPSDEQDFVEAFGPPTKVQDTLDSLNGAVSTILSKFDSIMQLPFLASLQIRNPWFAGKPSAPKGVAGKMKHNREIKAGLQAPPKPLTVHSKFLAGVTAEPEKIDLATLVTRYRALYLDLQNKTLPVARNLATYASAQIIMLPSLTISETPGPGQVALKEYTEINKDIVTEYNDTVSALVDDYLVFKQSWELSISNLHNAINEAEANIENAIQVIQQKKDEMKSKILWGVLEGLGALVLFAIGCFTLPAGMLAIAGAAGLMYKSISDLMAAGELDSALKTLEGTLNTARETKANLEILIPAMEGVKKAVSMMTDVWNQVAQNINKINTDMGIWSKNPRLFTAFGPAVTLMWQQIEDLVNQYSKIISGSTQGTTF